MLSLKKPPKPTWHGTPPNLVNRFVEFVRYAAPEQHQIRLARTASTISELENTLRYATSEVRRMRDNIRAYDQRIGELERQLLDTSDLAKFEDGLLALMYHPMLLGLRNDDRGRLVAHFRIYRDTNYVGDFEISLHTLGSQIVVCQTDVEHCDHMARGFEASRITPLAFHGTISIYRPQPLDLLKAGDLKGVADAAIDYIMRYGKIKAQLGLPVDPSEPTWQGVQTNPEQALRRTLEWSINTPTRESIAAETKARASARQSARYYADQIRTTNLSLEKKRAEQRRLEALNLDELFDPDDIRLQLQRITSLPGVMGVQFIDYDGHEVPVFHVRTTTVHKDQRYDLGDYEVRFIPHDGGPSVVNVHQTRSPYTSLYYHAERYSGPYRDWFCFGDRARELRKWFEAGRYDEFMHVAINSFNSVNPSDARNIADYFRTISMNAVWQPVGTTKRRRPRHKDINITA